MAVTASRAVTELNDVPGTIRLLDLHQNFSIAHSGNSAIVLIPTPSIDPDDPLNWAPRRKAVVTICICVYTMFVGMSLAVIYSVLVPLSEATEISIATLNTGSGYLYLLCGWGLILWQPLSLKFGKRPILLISVLGSLGFNMWGPYVHGNKQWIAKNILNGLFAAPIELLPEIMIADVYFIHQRGTYMALYALFLAGSNFFAPIICGFIAEYQGWKWVFYWPSIFLGVAFIFLFFFMEKTEYQRLPTEAALGDMYSQEPGSHTEAFTKADGRLTLSDDRSSMPETGIIRNEDSLKKVLFETFLPLRLVTWPVIFYAGFSYGSYLIWFNILNATASIILSGEPYRFSSAMVGVAYFSCLVGVFAATLYTGKFSDWLTLRLAHKNGGIMESEHRLWLFAVTSIVIPASSILWGVGAAYSVHWFGLIAAMCFLAFANCAGITISVNYLIESYPEISTPALTAVILIRNTMSFAIGYGITPWIENLGYQNCFISAAFLGLASAAVFLIMIKWGKKLRAASKVKYWKLAQTINPHGNRTF